VVAFTKSGLKVLGYGYDRNFGGRNFDEARAQRRLGALRKLSRRAPRAACAPPPLAAAAAERAHAACGRVAARMRRAAAAARCRRPRGAALPATAAAARRTCWRAPLARIARALTHARPVQVLYNQFAEEFKAKHKLDVRSNARASLRMRIQCEKTKKVLSSNPECPVSVECLMNDIDFRGHATRDAFEALAEPILGRVLQPMQAAMADAGLTPADISAVEVVGGASRLPALCKAVEGYFGKPIRRTLNAAESVARGCALQGAMLSPTFHVTRRFEVEDVASYPVSFSWAASEDGPGEERTASLVFPKGNPIPSAKMLTFFRSGVFPLDADVSEPGALSSAADAHLASFEIGPLPPPKAGGKSKLKVKARLNLHGCVSVESACVVEEQEADDAGGAGADDADAGAAADGAAPMDADAPKKKVTKVDVPVVTRGAGMAPTLLRTLTEAEFEMALQDRVMEETKERKNALEAYVLGMRTALGESLAEYATEDVKKSFGDELAKAEDWLYDEGEDESKGVYIERLAALKAVGDPIEERAKEAAAREPAASALRRGAEALLAAAGDAKYAHIEAAQLEALRKEANDALEWLRDKTAQQAAQPKTAPPALTSRDCVKKGEALERFAKPILATPKPAPPPPEPTPMEAEAPPPANAADLD
jgi:heat shock protein 4